MAEDFVIHNLFLPPKLPQAKYDKETADAGELLLFELSLEAISRLRKIVAPADRRSLNGAEKLLINSKKAHASSENGVALRSILEQLPTNGGDVAIHVCAQNAGLIISHKGDSMTFESFELSPENEQVYAQEGRLRRQFPASSVRMSSVEFCRKDRLETLSVNVDRMRSLDVAAMWPTARKAGASHLEDRDTPRPSVVTELLMVFLRSTGPDTGRASRLTKNTREEVLFDPSIAKVPWRRSPVWLLIRVALQLKLSRKLYKLWMVQLLAFVMTKSASRESDIQYAMVLKIERRLRKLELPADDQTQKAICAELTRAVSRISGRWEDIQRRQGTLSIEDFPKFDESADTSISIPALAAFTNSIGARVRAHKSRALTVDTAIVTFDADKLPDLKGHSGNYTLATLQAVEEWVLTNLRSWKSDQSDSSIACSQLGELLWDYFQLAQGSYANNPELTSIMVLTILDIWTSCDAAAIEALPMLRDYQPGIPHHVVAQLLLRQKDQMQQLDRVSKILTLRESAPYNRNVLFDAEDAHCLAARVFDQSNALQQKLEMIEADAEAKKQAKEREFARLKAEYIDLMAKSDAHYDHDEFEWVIDRERNITEPRHSRDCRKCYFRRQAKQLKIYVHEWPISRHKTVRKVVMFELDLPLAFSAWRLASHRLLFDVLKAKYPSPIPPVSRFSLQTDEQLSPSSGADRKDSLQRICLLSGTKPHIHTHRNGKEVGTASLSSVCVESGLTYRYFDETSNTFIAKPKIVFDDSVGKACTYQLPARSSTLQKFFVRPAADPNGLSPNDALASQYNAPNHMTLEEHEGLTGMLFGTRLQWPNILAQLAMPIADLRKEETTLVILQCIFQAGPASCDHDITRVTHTRVLQADFARRILKQLEKAICRVSENWEGAQAFASFISITLRVLSLHGSSRIHRMCFELLAKSREILFKWMMQLKSRACNVAGEAERNEFLSRAVQTALMCVASFDVERRHLERLLQSSEDASILLQCSMLIRESKQVCRFPPRSITAILQSRSERIMHQCQPILAASLVGCDEAVSRAWAGFNRSGAPWVPLVGTANHWITTTSSDYSDITATFKLSVHLNLLNGEFLVNGHPLNRPPAEIEASPDFQTLFGKSVVEVMPSQMPGMQFSTRKSFGGNKINFGLLPVDSKTSDLLVHTECADLRKFQLIPSRTFVNVLPDYFVQEFIHWFDVAKGEYQFRPRDDPWNSSSPAIWYLRKRRDGHWHLTHGGLVLLSFRRTCNVGISKLLAPLAESRRIHCFWNKRLGQIEIEIPHIRLCFFMTPNTAFVRSKEYSGMLIDVNQQLGTLVGLQNKLMMVNADATENMILIPEGEVTLQGSPEADGHVEVHVAQGTVFRIHALRVDASLRRLIDSGDIHGKIYLAFLHALTSFCLPDSLTKLTGTERALEILRSAAVRSFDQLDQNSIDLLGLIANLTPARKFYPKDEKLMQSVQWSQKLSFFAQHNEYVDVVASIFEQVAESQLFNPGSSIRLPSLDKGETDLLRRAKGRDAIFRTPSFGGEWTTLVQDGAHQARDRGQSSLEATSAGQLSNMIVSRQQHPSWALPDQDALWDAFETQSEIHAIRNNALPLKLGFTEELEPYYGHWFNLHHDIAAGNIAPDALRMWLATSAFLGGDVRILQIYALVYTRKFAQSLTRGASLLTAEPPRGYTYSPHLIRDRLRGVTSELHFAPEFGIDRHPRESVWRYEQRRDEACQRASDNAVNQLEALYGCQWPVAIPQPPTETDTEDIEVYLDLDDAFELVELEFDCWYRNLQFYNYLGELSQLLQALGTRSFEIPQWLQAPPSVGTDPLGCIPQSAMFTAKLPNVPKPPALPANFVERRDEARSCVSVAALVADLRTTSLSPYEARYADNLDSSLESLQEPAIVPYLLQDGPERIYTLQKHLQQCVEHLARVSDLVTRFAAQSVSLANSYQMHHGPRISPTVFLQQLRSHVHFGLHPTWRRAVVRYALAHAAHQRAERMLKAARSSYADLASEVDNEGHRNWNPFVHPEILLMEVESGFLVRDVQYDIALEMQAQDGKNAVMQLNMGEGKSSVIVPMLVSANSNGEQLTRVIVAKPQSKQMASMLVSKLGGMLNKRVFFMPFSRTLRIDRKQARIIEAMCRRCIAERGILLVQPEHLLSFQLMILDSLNTDKIDVGNAMLGIQKLFDTASRDIIDESDENLSPRFEVIYTMGNQQQIEMGSDRWKAVQQILELIRYYAPSVRDALPHSIEYKSHDGGSFPKVRLLRLDAAVDIFNKIGHHICDYGISGFPLATQSPELRTAVFRYITELDLTQDEVDQVEKSHIWKDGVKNVIMLLRGLLAGGILTFTFGQKRWRVNYGLDPARTPPTRLAVPYRAKDNPSARSEFSHPEVVLVLTSLSYYYGGLSDDELFLTLECLLRSDQASVEYQTWVQDATDVPPAFSQIEGINLQDRLQCIADLFPILRFGKNVVDFFLSKVVFPREMKEFPMKLSASGWDISKIKSRPTTGFSGTNDSRHVLPLDMSHRDLDRQKHTNAKVLDYLLQIENSVMHLDPAASYLKTDADALLDSVIDAAPEIRVILDVGAQVIQLNNLDMAKAWLKLKQDAGIEAAVFVNDDDEIMVVDRRGRLETLQTSPFATRLEVCLVFLDEAHTRGIDLKLPSHYRAAVTLGANLTKDRLVQACMRMRKLGQGQSVVFLITEEIHHKIQACVGTECSPARVSDVLRWSISETHLEIKRSIPLWAVQGERFVKHSMLWSRLHDISTSNTSTAAEARKFLEDEARSIEHRYQPKMGEDRSVLNRMTNSGNAKMKSIVDHCDTFQDLKFSASTLQEEQERELSPEIETERQVEKPEKVKTVAHALHAHVKDFATFGRLAGKSTGYTSLFEALQKTSAASLIDLREFAHRDCLFATTDFAKSVAAIGAASTTEAYQKSVQWILTNRDRGSSTITHAMVISAYEAQELIPVVEQSKTTALHLYRARSNLGYDSLDTLDLLTIAHESVTSALIFPRHLAAALDIFAGQLYVNSFQDYQETCKFLGVASEKATEGMKIAFDGFVEKDSEGRVGAGSGLSKSPIGFLKALMQIRRKGEGASKTHLGAISEGIVLGEDKFRE